MQSACLLFASISWFRTIAVATIREYPLQCSSAAGKKRAELSRCSRGTQHSVRLHHLQALHLQREATQVPAKQYLTMVCTPATLLFWRTWQRLMHVV